MGGITKTSWEKGCATANPRGRPSNPFVKQLREGLKKFEKEKGYSFIEQCINHAQTDSAIANAILKKIMPDLKQVESNVNVTGDLTLSHMDEDDLKSRIGELESLGTGRVISSEKRRAIKKSKR